MELQLQVTVHVDETRNTIYRHTFVEDPFTKTKQTFSREMLNLSDEATRAALIQLGWTPPGGFL